MTKTILCGLAAMLMSVSGSSALASDGTIDQSTLAAMGLAGAEIVNDVAASEVRGQGFLPIVIAAGGSFAYVGSHHAAAGSANGYFAAGNNFAGGVNGSVAGKTVRYRKSVQIGRRGGFTVSKSYSVKVYAGGFSASAAY